VDTAATAAEALSKLQLIPGGVDAVIVDMGLPDRKGEDLVREIRSIYPSLPIIIASGHAKDHLRSLFQGLNSISVVAKPYTAEQLRGALRDGGISSAGGSDRAQSPR
jgi:DNA-binding response OmpR family regulator